MIYVDPDAFNRNCTILKTLLPRESSSKVNLKCLTREDGLLYGFPWGFYFVLIFEIVLSKSTFLTLLKWTYDIIYDQMETCKSSQCHSGFKHMVISSYFQGGYVYGRVVIIFSLICL